MQLGADAIYLDDAYSNFKRLTNSSHLIDNVTYSSHIEYLVVLTAVRLWHSNMTKNVLSLAGLNHCIGRGRAFFWGLPYTHQATVKYKLYCINWSMSKLTSA